MQGKFWVWGKSSLFKGLRSARHPQCAHWGRAQQRLSRRSRDWRVVSLRNIQAWRLRERTTPQALRASSPCTGEPLNKEKNFKFLLTISGNFSIIKKLFGRYGGVAQLARALGSYPGCHWFKSNYRYHRFCFFHLRADMAELADAYGSGPYESNFMQVQVLLSVPMWVVIRDLRFLITTFNI